MPEKHDRNQQANEKGINQITLSPAKLSDQVSTDRRQDERANPLSREGETARETSLADKPTGN